MYRFRNDECRSRNVSSCSFFFWDLATTLAIGAGFIIPVFWGAAAGIIGTSGNCFSAAVSTPNFISGAAELL